MGKRTHRTALLLCILLDFGLIAGYYLYSGTPLGLPPIRKRGFGNPDDWLLFPDKEGAVLSETVTIRWDPTKVDTDTVIIEWTDRPKCDPNMAPEVCWQLWSNPDYLPTKIAEVPNTGEYQWDTTQIPSGDYNHIRLTDPSGSHWDASDYPFAIKNY